MKYKETIASQLEAPVKSNLIENIDKDFIPRKPLFSFNDIVSFPVELKTSFGLIKTEPCCLYITCIKIYSTGSKINYSYGLSKVPTVPGNSGEVLTWKQEEELTLVGK
jgi:hypothetical protein